MFCPNNDFTELFICQAEFENFLPYCFYFVAVQGQKNLDGFLNTAQRIMVNPMRFKTKVLNFYFIAVSGKNDYQGDVKYWKLI